MCYMAWQEKQNTLLSWKWLFNSICFLLHSLSKSHSVCVTSFVCGMTMKGKQCRAIQSYASNSFMLSAVQTMEIKTHFVFVSKPEYREPIPIHSNGISRKKWKLLQWANMNQKWSKMKLKTNNGDSSHRMFILREMIEMPYRNRWIVRLLFFLLQS